MHLYAFPHFAGLKHANEMPRVALVKQIVDRGTFKLDDLAAPTSDFFGSRFDLSRTPDGHYYSNKAPGLSFLGVPVYAVTRALGVKNLATTIWCLRLFVVTLPVLAFLWWFRCGIARFVDDESARGAAFLAYALGSPALPYATQFMSHALVAACVAGAFLLAMGLVRARPGSQSQSQSQSDDPKRARRNALLAGVLCGTAVLLEYQAFIATFYIGVYLLWKSSTRRRDVPLLLVGALPAAILLGAYHAICFGSPFRTGYSFHSEVFDYGVFGIIGPNRRALHHTLTDPANGMLLLSPWVVLGLVGLFVVLRDKTLRARLGAEAAICFAIIVTYVLFVGSLVPVFARAGWTVGPRHLLAAYPFAALLVAAGLGAAGGARVDAKMDAKTDEGAAMQLRARAAWIASRALIIFSVGVFVIATVTFPHWPDSLRNPLYEVSLRMLRHGFAAPSLGTALGLGAVPALLPLFAAATWVSLRLLRNPNRRGVAVDLLLATTLAATLFAAYGQFRGSGPEADRTWTTMRGYLL